MRSMHECRLSTAAIPEIERFWSTFAYLEMARERERELYYVSKAIIG